MATLELTKKQTEVGRPGLTDAFWERMTPHAFQITEWALVIGTLQFLVTKTHSLPIALLALVLAISLVMYLQAKLMKIEVVIPRQGRRKKLWAILAATLICLGFIAVNQTIVAIINAAGKSG